MIYYFGYGSNMNMTSLQAKGVEPSFSDPAVLQDWELAFNVCDFFRIEGGTGNIRRAAGKEVHGVVHSCHADSLRRLDELEAYGISYDRIAVDVTSYDGQRHKAFAYVGLCDRMKDGLQPSHRYLNIMIEGARKMELEDAYINKLKRIEVRPAPNYGPFNFSKKNNKVFSAAELAQLPHHTALAGAVFNMQNAREEHAYLKKFFSGKDMTVFFLKRMDISSGEETLEHATAVGLSNLQKRYLNAYLHEFKREYEFIGCMNYRIDLSYRSPTPRLDLSNPSRSASSRVILQTAELVNDILGHENLGFLSSDRGLIPGKAFPERLPHYFDAWEEITENLPMHYTSLRLRHVVDAMPVLRADDSKLDGNCLIRACALLSMLSHAYWYVRRYPPAHGLPVQLRKPWETVQQRLRRPVGVLHYIDLIVYNWQFKQKDREDNFDLSNLDLLFPTVNNPSEQIFYLTQLEILAHCSPIVPAIVRAQEAIVQNELEALKDSLRTIIICLKKIVRKSLFNIDPNRYSKNYVNHVVWAKTVAPFAVPFRAKALGASGTSSPIFNILDTFFGRMHHKTFLGKEIKALRETYPVFWQKFIEAVSQISLRDYVHRIDDPTLTNLVSEAVDIYAGEHGFLGRHRMKVFGYLEMAFKVGRDVTIGGFAGKFKDREHEHVDAQLEWSRLERLETFPRDCYFGYIKAVGQTHNNATANVKHVVIDVEGLGVRYEPGDRCLILPEHSEEIIAATMRALQAKEKEKKIILSEEWRKAIKLRYGYAKAQELPLEVFLRFAQLRPVSLRIAHALYTVSNSNFLRKEISAQTTARFEVWDVLKMLSSDGFDVRRLLDSKPDDPAYLAQVLPPENFRNYTIASAMDASEGDSAHEIHLTVGVVSYENNGRKCVGTGSGFLARSLGRDDPISFRIEHPPRFSLPADPRTPIMMIAGGTGVGAFRSFIFERMRDPQAGETWLLFFTQSPEYFYYQDDLLHALSNDFLKLFVKFSAADIAVDVEKSAGEGRKFFYKKSKRGRVEDFFAAKKHREIFWNFLQQDKPAPQVYICGRTRFARDVHKALQALFYRGLRGSEQARRKEALHMLGRLFASGGFKQETFTNAIPVSNKEKLIKVSELAQKNDSEGECWLAIDNGVYDLTEFQHIHPGGHTILRSYYGLDASKGYWRAHRRLDVDTMREIYRLGRLYLPNFANKNVHGVSLRSIYGSWTAALYTLVEMENSFMIDVSLQNCSLVATQAAELQTPYKTEKAIDTHIRFLENFLSPLTSVIIPSLWKTTSLLSNSKKMHSEIRRKISLLNNYTAAHTCSEIPQLLQNRLDTLVSASVSGELQQLNLHRLTATLDFFTALDQKTLAELKQQLTAGTALFENNLTEVDEHMLAIRKIFLSMVAIVQNFWKNMATHCKKAGWLTKDSVLIKNRWDKKQGMRASAVVSWLLGDALYLNSTEELIVALVGQLEPLVKINRISLDIHTVHPEVFVKNLIWKRNDGIEATLLSHDQIKSQLFRQSPVAKIYNGSGTIRIKTARDPSTFPLLQELMKQGCTDYIIFPMRYTRGGRSYISYTTEQPDGFSDAEIEVLEQVCPALARRLEIEFCHFSIHSLLQIYLGKLAASRVLRGEFKRGYGETIEPAIWLCDLRNYTSMAMSCDEHKVAAALDLFFELAADTIAQHNGDILKFMGDSMLVIFDDKNKKESCRKAFNASLMMLAKLNKQTATETKVSIAMHVGSAIFGNVGGCGRLDFTIVGKEVNYTSRLEPWCKALGVPLIMSDKFVKTAELNNTRYLGKFSLKGFPTLAPLYTVI